MSRNEVVLVVDDLPQSLGALCSELDSEGYTVLLANDGASALERLDLVTPDAILLDACMPGLGGFETCRRIKAEPAWAHIPVIFMTGLTDTEDIVEGFAAGGVDYVVKPVRAAEVLARLATHLRNARAVRLARAAVDVAGLGVVVVDARGRLAWRSPQAQAWIDAHLGSAPGAVGEWLAGAPAAAGPLLGASEAGEGGEGRAEGDAVELREQRSADGHVLVARRLGEVGLGETMWLLRLRSADEAPLGRIASAALTPRETEVLSWVAKGKTNRDVADILGMSPRTVNKHLEHVFEKLGVETRAAAAALASRELGGGAAAPAA